MVCLGFLDDPKFKTENTLPHSKECGFKFMDITNKMEYLTLESRKPEAWEVEAMELWIRTGCVTADYMKRVLGEQSKGIIVEPKGEKNLEKLAT